MFIEKKWERKLTSRSFLCTPRKVITEKIEDGSFWCGGTKNCLEKTITANTTNPIPLNFNMDGLPLSKSLKVEFWPILMSDANDSIVKLMFSLSLIILLKLI